MDFSPAFALLRKFSIDLATAPKDEEEVIAVSRYLGIGSTSATLDERIALLASELESQNRFLSNELNSNSIYNSDQYRKSLFIREVVANNRINLKRREARER